MYRWPIDIWKDAQCLESLEKCKLKPQWGIISHLSEWLSSIHQQTTSDGKEVEKEEPFCTVGGSADWCTVESNMEIPQKLKMDLPFDPVIPLLGLYTKKPKTLIQENISTPTFIAVLFTITNIWKQPKCPSIDEWIKQLWDIYTMEYYLAIKRRKFYLLQWCGWTWRTLC